MNLCSPDGHARKHGRTLMQPPASDLIHIGLASLVLQAGLAGLAGLSMPDFLRCQARPP